MLGRWSLDENTGTAVNDTSSSLHHGVIRNSVQSPWVIGRKGSAINFDGNNDVSFPANPAFQTPSLTASAWVKVNNNFLDYGWIVSEGDNYGLVVNRTNPGDLFFYFYNGNNWPSINIPNVPFYDNNWHHLAATFNDATKTSSLYFDGVLQDNKIHVDSIVYAVENGVHIGSKTGDRNFEGQIDEVQIFDRALTSTEITALFSE